jgi:hypothetical protein
MARAPAGALTAEDEMIVQIRMGLHEVDRDVIALGVVVVRVLRIHDLEHLILRIVLDELRHVLDMRI